MRFGIIYMVCGLVMLTGCSSDPPVESHSPEVITVDPAFDRDVDIAIVEVHNEMADWIVNDDGSKSDPTYKAGSQMWKDGQGKQAETRCVRSYMEFDIKDNGSVRIETVYIAGKTIVVLMESDNKEAVMQLHNVLLKKISDRCVKQ